MPNPAPRRLPRRNWIDALVTTALRWNDRLSRPVGDPEDAVAPPTAPEEGAIDARRGDLARPASAMGAPRGK